MENDKKQRSNVPSLVCAFMASLTTGGTTYAFGLYGGALKKTLNLTQGQLDTISTAFFVAGLFSWLPGLCADRFGTRVSLSLGGFLGATSLLSYWVVSRQFVVLPHTWLVPTLSALGVAIFLSNALTTGSVFKIIVSSCGPGTKGSAVGAAKGFVGLGAGAYACLFEAIRRKEESDLDFLPMAAFFAICCATVPALMILPTRAQLKAEGPMEDDATPLHFRTLYFSLLAMALLIAGNSMLELMEGNVPGPHQEEEEDEEKVGGPNYGIAFLLVTIWLGPISALLYLPRRDYREVELTVVNHSEQVALEDDQEGQESDEEEQEEVLQSEKGGNKNRRLSASAATDGNENEAEDSNSGEEQATLLHSVEYDADDSTAHLVVPPPQNYNLAQMLQTPSALLMLWTTTILVGAGTVETNNMGQMVESLGFSGTVTPASLALFSVAQAGARVATGSISEAALSWNVRGCCIERGAPRPVFLVVASVIGFLSHFMLGLAESEFFFVIGATLAGAAFGMVWPLMVLVTGEVFGTRHVGANYMFFDGFTSAAGTLLLSKFVAQEVYEAHINSKSPDPFTCIGTGCFRRTHMIVSMLSLTCVGTSLATLYFSRHVYANRPHDH